MTDTPRKDLAASVRDRLQNHARTTGQDFQRVLVRYGVERLLYRLALSGMRDRFGLNAADRYHGRLIARLGQIS